VGYGDIIASQNGNFDSRVVQIFNCTSKTAIPSFGTMVSGRWKIAPKTVHVDLVFIVHYHSPKRSSDIVEMLQFGPRVTYGNPCDPQRPDDSGLKYELHSPFVRSSSIGYGFNVEGCTECQ